MMPSPEQAGAILREHHERTGRGLTEEQAEAIADAFLSDVAAKDRAWPRTMDAIDEAKRVSALARLKLLMERRRCTCDQADVCDLRTHGGHETPHRYILGKIDPQRRLHGRTR